MSDKHQATFTWPAGPSKVIVTGSFDNWAKSTELTKTDSGFSKTLDVPWDSKIAYKYLVDGQWKANPSAAQEYDSNGNLNNIYTSPPKPTTSAPPASVPSVPVAEKVEEVKVTAVGVVDSAAATAGTSSILSYVTSGVGAAIATVTGYDPVNPQQIPVEDAPTPAVADPAPAPISEPERAKSAPVTNVLDLLAPIKDEPIVLHLASDTVDESAKEKTVTISDAPEPYKETNGHLPAELESPTTDATSTSHPTEVTTTAVEAAAKETKETAPTSSPVKKEGETTPRTSNASPPTTPKKFAFAPRRSTSSVTGSSIHTDTTSPNGTKRKKRDSFFGKIKDVFHHSPKKEKASP